MEGRLFFKTFSKLKIAFGTVVIPVIILMIMATFPTTSLSATKEDYCVIPPFIGQNIPPLVMLDLARNHKLYYEAYNDASDLDGDGKLDIGYNHSIEYYGYFDPDKCYVYTGSGASAKFTPVSVTSNRFCNAGEWSGNVLNWLTMSRMDVLRKVLYGGYRVTDSSSTTILERSFIPQDAHSWGKEFTGRLCSDGTNYTNMCMTDLDCETGSTCVDKSINLIGIAAPGAPTTCTASPVSWDSMGNILVARYGHSSTKNCGLNHNSMLNSYEPSNFQTDYYVTDFNDPQLDPSLDHAGSNLNLFAVVEFYVDPADAGNWDFIIDGDDDVEAEIDGEVVTTYYGCHGPCFRPTASSDPNNTAPCSNQLQGTKSLTSGWHRLIVRHFERGGWEGARLWYRKPGAAVWEIFGDTLQLRAPNIAPGNECSITTQTFIETGEPSSGTIISSGGRRHLFCNVTTSANGPPLLRLITDKTNRIWEWASKERAVCNDPSHTRGGYPFGSEAPQDFTVRVEVCKSGLPETKYFKKYCKTYPGGGGVAKPVGLFQKYSEGTKGVCSKSFNSCLNDNDCDTANGEICTRDALMYFGLMTGSYTKNLSGGVLRKNVWDITDETNPNTGIFQTSENVEGNIIITIDRMKTVNFDYSSYTYDCGWITSRPINEGECNMWGNPMAEILYESTRYFANFVSPTADFMYSTNSDEGLQLSKLGTKNKPWIPVYSTFPECAKAFNLMISDVNPNYDSDQVPGSSFSTFSGDLPGLDVSSIADLIATTEGISGNNYFIGESGSSYDFMCTEKPVTGLSDVRGLCPEEPTKQGSFYTASIAYYGKELLKVCSNDPAQICTSDADCTGSGTCTRDKNITTYSVALSAPLPKIEIKTDTGNVIRLVPTGKSVAGCLNVGTYCDGKSTLSYDPATGLSITNAAADAYCPTNQIVDFYIDSLGDKTGRFRINYEDVEQGADHDMDAIVEYEYCVGNACNPAIGPDQVKIKLTSTYAAGCIEQAMGFVVSGTTEDGTYLSVRDVDSGSGSTTYSLGMPLSWSKVFTASPGPLANNLNDPLWYAAKWGGFEDSNSNKIPDLQEEWDKDGNGVPDTYFYVTNPLRLEEQLESAFLDILKRASSGTAVSVLASSEGSGANMFQALFYPSRLFGEGSLTSEITWTGVLHALWYYIAPDLVSSNIREDTVDDKVLSLTDDYITSLFFDSTQNKTRASRCADVDGDGLADNNGDGLCDSPQPTIDIEDIKNLWEAGTLLFLRDPATRTILTNLDNDTTLDTFDISNNALLQPLLDATDPLESKRIIEYTRGKDIKVCSVTTTTSCTTDADCPVGETCIQPYRNRTATLNINGTTTTNTWKLGDIISSTPKVQSPTPVNGYHLSSQSGSGYDDKTYKSFINTTSYKDRQMVYVGANDGMLHTFNLGKLNVVNDRTQIKATLEGPDIGKEEWAFIPQNALPYLKYLMEEDYCHLYLNDASPYIVDASIGTTTGCTGNYWTCTKTVDSWRTILIGSMKLGGACRDISATCTDCVKTPASNIGYSSYYALDITDPLNPQLLWEFSAPDLGFATSNPIVVRTSTKDPTDSSPEDTTNGRWFVVLASGPTGPINTTLHEFLGKSDQNLKLFILDLKTGTLLRKIDTGIQFAFGAGSTNTAVDLDINYQDDVFYLGYVKRQKSGPDFFWNDGGVLRVNTNEDIDPNTWQISTLIDNTGPVTTTVRKLQSPGKDLWIYFGTGRYFYKADSNTDRNKIFGVKEPCFKAVPSGITDKFNDKLKSACTTTVSLAGLDNATLSPPATASTGWYINLDCASTDSCSGDQGEPLPSGFGAERVMTDPEVSTRGVVFFTTFSPTSDVCGVGGNTYIWALEHKTGGAPSPRQLFGKVLLQVSTGEIKELDLKKAFTEKKPTGGSTGGRRTAGFFGVPPQGGGLMIIGAQPPVKKVIHLQER